MMLTNKKIQYIFTSISEAKKGGNQSKKKEPKSLNVT